MKTYEQALQDQWAVAYHRLIFAKAAAKDGEEPNCECDDCLDHLAALKKGKEES